MLANMAFLDAEAIPGLKSVGVAARRRWSLSGYACGGVGPSRSIHHRSHRRLSDLSTILESYHHHLASCPEEDEDPSFQEGDHHGGGDEQACLDAIDKKHTEDCTDPADKLSLPHREEGAAATPRLLTRTVSSVSCNRTSSRHRRSRSRRFSLSLISISSSIAASLSTAMASSPSSSTANLTHQHQPPTSPHRSAPLKSAMRSPPATTASLDALTDGLTLGDAGAAAPSTSSSSITTSTAVDALNHHHHPASLATSVSSTSQHDRNRRRSSHGAYVSRVSFDDTNSTGGGGGTGFDQSYTLRATTSGFIRTRESRTFLVATDLNAYSMHALNWAIDSLIEDGDELVVLRVLDPSTSSISLSRSSLSEQAKEEAASLMRTVEERNSSYPSASHHNYHSLESLSADNSDVEPINEIGITIEHVIGKVQESIQKIIKVYRPDSLIVGTRGRSDSLLKSAFIGSVSRYCVAESPVPVVVVRPSTKVRKTVDKREGRQTYRDLVEGSGRPGSSSGAPVKVSTGLGMPRSSTLPTGTGSGRHSSPTRPKTSSGALNKITVPLTKTKTLS